MSKRGMIIATVVVTLAVIAFKNDPVTGQNVLTGLFSWILP